MDTNLTKEAALAYAAEGWPVLRCYTNNEDGCACGKPNCASPGKHPYKTTHGVHDATTDLDQIAAWRGRYNVGIALGHKGLVALDIDDADAAHTLLSQEAGLRDITGAVRTHRGVHIYFNVTGKVPKTCDIFNPESGANIGQLRSLGGYVVAPPSVRAGGKSRYSWIGMRRGDWIPNLAATDNATAYAQRILNGCGVPAELARPVASGDLSKVGDISEIIELPPKLRKLGALMDIRRVLSSKVTRTIQNIGDRSRILQRVAAQLAYAGAEVGHRFTDEELAGILKAYDRLYVGKYIDRDESAADREYVRSAKKVLSLPSAQPKQRAKPHPAGIELEGVDEDEEEIAPAPSYIWDEETEQLCFVWSTSQGKRRYQAVANFKPEILATAIIDDPDVTEKEVAWRIRSSANGVAPAEVALRSKDYSKSRSLASALIQHLPYGCMICKGGEDHILAAVKSMSQKGVASYRIPAVPGWYKHGADSVYVMPGGDVAIGPRGVEPSFELHKEDLSADDAMHYPPLFRYGVGVEPTSSVSKMHRSWRAFRLLFRTAPKHVAGAVIFQVLAGPLFDSGLSEVPPLVHVVGKTGVLKTSYSLAVLSLMGRFTDSSAPATWGSTPFGLAQALHHARHMTLLVDDYKKSRRNMTGLIQQYADGSYMIRHSLSGHTFEQPRGLILSNGEDRFRGEASVAARTTTVEVKDGDINSARLTRCQQAADEGLLAHIGAAYLQWLAGSGILTDDTLRGTRDSVHKALLAEANVIPGHRRLLRSVASLLAAGEVICRFVKETCDEPDVLASAQAALGALREHFIATSAARASEIEELAPLDHFLGLLSEKVAARDAKFAARDTGARSWPDSPRARVIGWHRKREHIYLTEHVSFAYYQEELRGRGETVAHDWSSITQDIRERYPGAHVQIKLADPSPPGDVPVTGGGDGNSGLARKTPRWVYDLPFSAIRGRRRKDA